MLRSDVSCDCCALNANEDQIRRYYTHLEIKTPNIESDSQHVPPIVAARLTR